MNIVYASDNNFAEILGISMISLFENNKDCEEIVVYILDDGIDEDNKSKLNAIAEQYGRILVLNRIPNLHELAGVEIHTNARWSLSTFSRLFLEKILPEDVHKALYLDCDMLINDSLTEMYNTELGEYYCGGVRDCISDNHKANIELNPSDNYINAGMMLIDLDNWRKNSACKSFVGFINKYGGNTPYVDQGVINGTISNKIKILDFRYNCYTAAFDFSYKELLKYRKPSEFYSETEVVEAVKNPAIVHFTTSFLSLRPWVEGCKHPYVGEWLRYKAMSPWADVPIRKDNRSGKKKLAVKIFNALPRGLAVGIAGILHARVVPMMRGRKR